MRWIPAATEDLALWSICAIEWRAERRFRRFEQKEDEMSNLPAPEWRNVSMYSREGARVYYFGNGALLIQRAGADTEYRKYATSADAAVWASGEGDPAFEAWTEEQYQEARSR